MDFARALGAEVINTNAAARRLRKSFFANIEVLARHAETIGLKIGLENPGDGSDNLLNTASDAAALLADIGHAMVGLNYDAGNTISHRSDVSPVDDALAAMPLCLHTHIKDVRRDASGYFFTPLGQGSIDCARILQAVTETALNLSVEIPLRLHRLPNAQPSRSPYRVPLADIEAVLKPALAFVQQHLSPLTASQ
jgi:sugar phosphate isomerase/epimerase